MNRLRLSLKLLLLSNVLLSGCLAAKNESTKQAGNQSELNEVKNEVTATVEGNKAEIKNTVEDVAIETQIAIESEASLTRKEQKIQADRIEEAVNNQGLPPYAQILIAIVCAIVVVTLFILQLQALKHSKTACKHLIGRN